jgi:molybdopterin synthase catalytic subunit
MSVSVKIIDGPLAPAAEDSRAEGKPGDLGAVLRFEGIVRALESGKPIVALDYEVYQPMAERQLETIAEEVIKQNGLLAVRVEHSRGRVPVGGCSFRLVVASSHRGPALRAVTDFADRLKQDVPIWKTAVTE